MLAPTVTSSVSTCAISESPKTLSSSGLATVSQPSTVGRNLQVALVIDLNTKEGLASRRAAVDEMIKLSELQNFVLQV